MRTNTRIFLMMLLVGATIYACGPANKGAGNYSYETQCMGSEGDGTQTVKAWGSGRNRTDAIEQAKKNAVRDVIFTGIKAGKDGCNNMPLVFEVNAREKYEDYFNAFFVDEGPYAAFITDEDGSDLHFKTFAGRAKAGSEATYGVIVRVQRPKLKDKLKADNILK